MSRMTSSLASLLIIGAVFGCGGGNHEAQPLATRMTTLRHGDEWYYRVDGWVLMQGKHQPVSGQLKVWVDALPLPIYDGMQAVIQYDYVFNGAEFAPSARQYVQQDAITGEVRLIGDAGGGAVYPLREVKGQAVLWPGVWSLGNCPCHAEFTNGDVLDASLQIVGSEVITTPAGSFTTWRCATTIQDSRNGAAVEEEWWAPQLGGCVKFTSSLIGTGYTGSVTAVLESTNKMWR